MLFFRNTQQQQTIIKLHQETQEEQITQGMELGEEKKLALPTPYW